MFLREEVSDILINLISQQFSANTHIQKPHPPFFQTIINQITEIYSIENRRSQKHETIKKHV